jgi:hypothetical protein
MASAKEIAWPIQYQEFFQSPTVSDPEAIINATCIISTVSLGAYPRSKRS